MESKCVAKIRSNSHIRSDELVINVVVCLSYLLGSRSTAVKMKKESSPGT